jgi:hypothetical protein
VSPDLLLLVTFGPAVIAGAAATLLLLSSIWRDPGRPTTAEWTREQLQTLLLACAPGGAHRAAGPRACDLIAATPAGYQPRHGFDEIPPSLVCPLTLMTPAERARELVRQLPGAELWWPWAGQTDRPTRVRLRAWAIAHRHGIRPLLGTFQLQGVLP